MVKKVYIAAFLLLIVVAWLLIPKATNPKTVYRTVDGLMLGTTYHVVARTPLDEKRLREELAAIDREMRASMSIFEKGSLISRINDNTTTALDRHIEHNIAVAAAVNAISGGKYDITVKPLTDAYGFGAPSRTEQPNIDSLLQFVGFSKFSVTDHHIVKSDPRVQIDLNSVAKGYAVDVVAERLEELGCTDYIVEIGGEIRSHGKNSRGKAWRVGVDAPYEGNSPGEHRQTIVKVGNAAVASSGNYRRFYTNEAGEKIVHTVNPLTGRSTQSRLLSATVITSKCAMADALATMFMAMGDVEARALAEKMRDSVQVYFILAPTEGDTFEVFSTLSDEQQN